MNDSLRTSFDMNLIHVEECVTASLRHHFCVTASCFASRVASLRHENSIQEKSCLSELDSLVSRIDNKKDQL